jgi:hypothetical protein
VAQNGAKEIETPNSICAMMKTLLDDILVRVTIIPKNIFPPAANKPKKKVI